MPPSRQRGVSRREFVKAAVAIGGAAALSTCLGRENPDLPQGPDDLSGLSRRQHAWNAALRTDDHGNHVPPKHHLLLYLDYAGDGTPTDADRGSVQTALRSLERAYPRSTEDGEVGLLFTIGYAPAYFDRFEGSLPESVDLPAPEPLAPFENPVPDEPDAVVHLASDYGSVLLAGEEGLLGERDEVNGYGMEATFDGVFERASLAEGGRPRRTGFIGDGLPAENQDVAGIPDSEPVPDDAPLYMGFESGFEKTQATEDRVTIGEGPFAGGTTQHVSSMDLNLTQWYEQDSREHREASMFCPAHADNNVIEGTGENLGNSSGVGGCAETVEADARDGVVGHAQKNARAREDGRPVMLRRDFDSTDGDRAGLHFLALQESISDFVETREAMNGTDAAAEGAVGQRANNGILQYINVRRRGNYLLPPRESRALPAPNPGE
ncbi:DUF7405 family protein [Halosimplex marinum]|uniref:DUF7405 family protein n=1 Tax=Halosimplex marinum TaxID=3396620 RepID=UPI003F5515B8